MNDIQKKYLKKTCHLSKSQRLIVDEFSKLANRPDEKQYWAFQKRMESTCKVGKKFKIANTERGYEANEYKLMPNFNAAKDLPEGLGFYSMMDSGSNHRIDNAGVIYLRLIWNSWNSQQNPQV
jgi:hypothetical protein